MFLKISPIDEMYFDVTHIKLNNGGIMRIYALGDIHGCLEKFDQALSLINLSGDAMLVLLGDYIHGPDSYCVLDRVMELQMKYGKDKVIALLGNHEEMAIDGSWPISDSMLNEQDDYYLNWMASLPRYFVTENQIFVHAGVDEETGHMWEVATDESVFTAKYPAQTGRFYKKIIAGHIATEIICGNPGYNDIYYDGESHYYLDGNVLEYGSIPVIMVDTDQNKYYRVTKSGNWLILPYDEEN